MIKREFKVNFKSFIIWLAILIIIFLVVYLVYPYIITDETMKSIDEMMTIFPEGVLKAFNMDITSISSAYGWFKSEGFTFILLIFGIYSSLLGSNILLKEEDDKTIEYLSFLPIKRSKIVTSRVITGISYILIMVILFCLFNYVSLLLSGSFNQKEFLLLSITPIFVSLPLFALSLFISTFFHNSKKVIGIPLGIVFISYILSVLSEISDKVKFLKYTSIYTLADIRNVMESCSINTLMIIISFIITAIFIMLTYIRYNKKELVA